MKINYTIRKLLLFIIAPLLTITLITSCGDDDDGPVTPPPSEDLNLVELAQSDENFSTLVSVIEDLGLEETLASGDFTIFAPTNAAFNALPDGVLESLTDEQLLDIIQFHVTEGSVPSSALGAQQDVEMLNEENTLVQSSAAGVVVNGSSNVVEADLEATNGFIHAIDEVLLPSAIRIALGQPNLVDVAQESGQFETLIGLVEDVGLTTTLQYLGPYTAFAPTDAAFTALFEEVDAGSLTPEQITFILTYHVISGPGIASGDLAPEQAVASAAEELLYITSGEGGVTVNGNASVIDADVQAENGIIHVVDNVLLPNAFLNTVQVAQKNYNFTTLVDLIVQANLAETVATTELTVFAPTNAAFDALFAEVDPANLTAAQLEEILLYHTIPGATIASGDLTAQQNPASTTGEALYITVDGDVVVNGNSTVVTADVASNNGIIHAVDTVLMPNSLLDVPSIAQKNYDLTTLVGLLVDNNLVGTLEGAGPFTVFAPTNAAFEAISDVVSGLTAAEVVEVLTYHVLEANVESGDIVPPQTATMLNGQDITITVENEVVTITDAAGGTAQVTVADQVGTNGVVHIIDSVLIPTLDGGNGGGSSGDNIIINGDFSAGLAPWSTFVADFAGVSADIDASGGEAAITNIAGAGAEVWHIQLNQILSTEQIDALVVGENYKVTFDASAGVDGRQLKLYFGENEGGFVPIHEANFNLTTSTAPYETVFTVGQTFGDMKLGFEMGLSNENAFIDNVTMEVTQEEPNGGGNGGGNVAEPTTAAPTPPTRDAANVISVFSDAYTNTGVTTFETEWSQGSEVGNVEVATGDFIKLYEFGNFIGIQLDNAIDLTDFTHMHFDYWVADESLAAGAVFNPKLSNHANLPGTEGETSAIESTNPVSTAGQWVSFDVALDDFSAIGSADRDKIYQLVMSTSGTISNIYIDNLYFYK